jgi:hypothetical protein
MREYMRKQYEYNARWVRAYKVLTGCKDCGYHEHHAGLEFDHLVPRLGDRRRAISTMMGRSLKKIQEEIAKCDVVCGTCHGIRTWNRLQENMPL